MSTFLSALQQFRVDLLSARSARHEKNILNLMTPTTSWFGLRTTQLSRKEAENIYLDSTEWRFVQMRGKRWIDELEALITLESLGADPLERASNDMINALREGGYL